MKWAGTLCFAEYDLAYSLTTDLVIPLVWGASWFWDTPLGNEVAMVAIRLLTAEQDLDGSQCRLNAKLLEMYCTNNC